MRRAIHSAVHHSGCHHSGLHGIHVFQHPIHVADHHFPHFHVVPPACHLVRIPDREKVSFHLGEREDFIFSTSTFMASICCLCISIIFWCCALGVGPLADAGACEGAACGHAADVRVNISTNRKLLNFIGSLLSDNLPR